MSAVKTNGRRNASNAGMANPTASAAIANGAREQAGTAKPAREQTVEQVSQAPQIAISRLAQEHLLVPILGTTPLIVHNFSEKSKRTMLDAMQGRKTPKQPKDPQAEYEAAFYRCNDGSYGFPSNGFKLATVDASRFYGKDVTKVGLRQFMFIFGEGHETMAHIEGEPHMREDVVRVGQGVRNTDQRSIRFR